jgi:hypothetical protein
MTFSGSLVEENAPERAYSINLSISLALGLEGEMVSPLVLPSLSFIIYSYSY